MSGITHEWNGTILTITSDSGTSSADLKGDKGDDGIRGAQGIPGSGYTLTEGDMATILDLVMANISQDASGISYSDTNNLDVDNVQDALDAVFQLGTNRHAELVSSLQYSGLGITEETSWDEIFALLEARFPDAIYDVLSTWVTDGLDFGTSSAVVERQGDEIVFAANFADGHTGYCETSSIPVGNYAHMRIVGEVSCTAGSLAYAPTVTISSNGKTLHSFTVPNGGYEVFEVNADAAENLKVAIYGRYQEVAAVFTIYLHNETEVTEVV